MLKISRLLAALAAVLALLLAGCAGTTGTPSAGDGPAGGAAKPSKPAADTGGSKIGDKYTYKDGLAVEITKATREKIGKYASGGKPGSPMVLMTVRLTNKTPEAFDPALTTVSLSYGPDGDQAEAVFDSKTGAGFEGTIAKGKAKSARYAFAVPKKYLTDVSVEIAPGLEYEPAIFTGAVK